MHNHDPHYSTPTPPAGNRYTSITTTPLATVLSTGKTQTFHLANSRSVTTVPFCRRIDDHRSPASDPLSDHPHAPRLLASAVEYTAACRVRGFAMTRAEREKASSVMISTKRMVAPICNGGSGQLWKGLEGCIPQGRGLLTFVPQTGQRRAMISRYHVRVSSGLDIEKT